LTYHKPQSCSVTPRYICTPVLCIATAVASPQLAYDLLILLSSLSCIPFYFRFLFAPSSTSVSDGLLALLGRRPLGINLYRHGMIKGLYWIAYMGRWMGGEGSCFLALVFVLLSCCLGIYVTTALHCMAWLALGEISCRVPVSAAGRAFARLRCVALPGLIEARTLGV
jgi:hypothetical protein